jgi:hypothetical protein
MAHKMGVAQLDPGALANAAANQNQKLNNNLGTMLCAALAATPKFWKEQVEKQRMDDFIKQCETVTKETNNV